MINSEIEEFTFQDAIKAGLPEALERGETKIEGSYEICPKGSIKFKQRNFVFKDKYGNLRVGKFKDTEEIFAFITKIRKG